MSSSKSVNVLHRQKKKSLGELLVEKKVLDSQELERALAIQRTQGGRLGEIIIAQGLAKPEQLAPIISIHLNVPFIDLKRHTINPEALKLIPEEMARRHIVIPLDIANNKITVVMSDPQNIDMINDIAAQCGMMIEVALGMPADIEKAIDQNYKPVIEIEKRVGRPPSVALAETRLSSDLIAKTPIAQSLDLIIKQAIRDRASDIHVEPQEHRLRIRYRIDGVLHDMYSLPITIHAELLSRIKILADMNIAQQRRPQDGKFSTTISDHPVDIRAATAETAYGERVTLRILDKSLSIFTLSELGFGEDAVKKYQAMLSSPFGIILVGGPTGSGKTTTLYTSINQLNRDERNIMTIEDPIEYRFENISQSQVNPQAGIDFATGLRALLRQDPDVILVGEIRDKETATVAVQAALTGHLVLSSIHANDATSILLRLMDLGIDPTLIASTLIGTIAQRMVRRICPDCRTSYIPSLQESAVYEEELNEKATLFFTGNGCSNCAGTGYRGRTALFELLGMSETIRKMVLRNSSAKEIREQALHENMITMKRDGMLKVKAGTTSMSEVLRSVFLIDQQ